MSEKGACRSAWGDNDTPQADLVHTTFTHSTAVGFCQSGGVILQPTVRLLRDGLVAISESGIFCEPTGSMPDGSYLFSSGAIESSGSQKFAHHAF